MGPILTRIAVLTVGLAFAELGLDAVAHGSSTALPELAIAVVALVAGSAGFVVPLLAGEPRHALHRDD